MPSTSSAPGTRTQWVDDRLRDAILEGVFPPGTPLRAEDLAQRWQVSPTPVREALQRLAGVGFVELRPRRGARVAEASIRDVEEVYELRLLLEPVALAESLGRADDQLRAEIERTCTEYETALRSARPLGEILAAHRAFHAALLARCPNARMLELIDGLAEHSQRFQVLAIGAPRGHHDVIAEHRTLCDHAVSGRVDEAVAFLRDHLHTTLEGARD
ncbi:MAG: GntR family transcriptional regulator [Acidimicrobiia bacterium]|nr:GntR family transcriptional regulator [Acidimicrobiia bacterium]